MKTFFSIEIRMYTEEQLMEKILIENFDTAGVCDVRYITPLRKNRICRIEFEYSESTTVGDAAKVIIHHITDGETDSLPSLDDVTFISNDRRYYIDGPEKNFAYLVDEYFDPDHSGNIDVQVLICMDAGEICTEDGIRYYMNSKEEGSHHEPHVHVSVIGKVDDASIAISDGRVLAGKIRTKFLNRAKMRILSDQKFFYECWNAKTDGLRVDINKALGLVYY